jgi:glucose-6-phosphate isomerase
MVQQLIEGPGEKHVFVNRVTTVEDADGVFTPRIFPEMPFFEKEISLGRVMGAQADSFELSLEEAKIPFTTLTVKGLNERSLGALFMLWQMTIAQLGDYLGIDAFNQPGVELGKRHAAKILRET